MENIQGIGNRIREKRLSLNMRMSDVANSSDITRATLSSIENGEGNYTINSLFRVMQVLGISLSLDNEDININRDRATRANTKMDKKINRFVIMCTEQYASYTNERSDMVYKKMREKGVINELINDYEDLHGMSTVYINDYIASLLGGGRA